MPEENNFQVGFPMIALRKWKHHKQVVKILDTELTDS